jgi:hypothetical protein
LRGVSGASVPTTIMMEPSSLESGLPLLLASASRKLYCPSSLPTGAPFMDNTPPKLVCTSTPTV